MHTPKATGNASRDYWKARTDAAIQANQEDGELWRWFSLLYEDHRIRWCRGRDGWLVSIGHRHVATEHDFDTAIRTAHVRFQGDQRLKAKIAA